LRKRDKNSGVQTCKYHLRFGRLGCKNFKNNFVTETRTEGRHESWLALKQACSMSDRKFNILRLLHNKVSYAITKDYKYVFVFQTDEALAIIQAAGLKLVNRSM